MENRDTSIETSHPKQLDITSRILTVICMLVVILSSTKTFAQEADDGLDRRNTVKFHVISTALYSKSVVLSYERIVKPNQSFAIMAGYVQFPTVVRLGPLIDVDDDNSKNGLTLGGEYRFYLKKENKYPAPHGVFIGPYANYYKFGNDRMLTVEDPDGGAPTQATLNSDVNVFNVGFQMGYQFVLNNRWTIDLVFIGPSLSQYRLKAKLDSNFDPDELDLIQEELLENLLNRFPLLKELLDDEEIDVNGTTTKWAPGFRYQLNLGYRFGGKRK